MNVSDAIKYKRAVRQFNDQRLTPEQISIILNAGRRAQSAKNSQPWHFIAIQDRDILEELSKLGHYASHLAGASLGVAVLTPDPAQRFSIMFDAGQATAYMQLAAWEMGIGSCLATIYEPEEARQLLGFPEDLHLRIAISFGFPMEKGTLRSKPVKGGRRSVDQVIHKEIW